jgi:hypothetical protein
MINAIFWFVVYVSREVTSIPDLTNEIEWLAVPTAQIIR